MHAQRMIKRNLGLQSSRVLKQERKESYISNPRRKRSIGSIPCSEAAKAAAVRRWWKATSAPERVALAQGWRREREGDRGDEKGLGTEDWKVS